MKMMPITMALIASTAMADELDCVTCRYAMEPVQPPAIVQQLLAEPPRNYGYQAPVPVVPIERGSYYNSNQYGSVYSNPRTGTFCSSNRYSSTCF